MSDNNRITDVRFRAGTPEEAATGLIGWVSFTLNDTFRLDGVAVRRTVDRRVALSFPARRDRSGNQHFYFRPVDDRSRREIEYQVFQPLGLAEALSR